MIPPICVGFASVHTGHGSQRRRRPGSFRGSGAQSNGLIWRFVFPPSGIWCQFSESFGPNCGWNVDHHSPHLSGQPRPTKTTRRCYHVLYNTMAGSSSHFPYSSLTLSSFYSIFGSPALLLLRFHGNIICDRTHSYLSSVF